MSKLFGYDFWFKERHYGFNYGRRRRPYRTLYTIIACIFIVVYSFITEKQGMDNLNKQISASVENEGGIVSDASIESIVSDIDQSRLEILSKGIYKNNYKPGKKLVLYSGNNSTMKLYKQSPDWTKKFEFVKVKTGSMEGAYSAVKKPCKGICVIDFEKRKLYSIPQDKVNDSKYIYNVLSKCYN